jgi:hypothetical protein
VVEHEHRIGPVIKAVLRSGQAIDALVALDRPIARVPLVEPAAAPPLSVGPGEVLEEQRAMALLVLLLALAASE